jgi:UDP-N-acetylmuramoylalanine--D-glutamate ligase
VAVLGLGRTGIAAGLWLADHGVRVYASDADDRPEVAVAAETLRSKTVAVDVGSHDLSRIQSCAAVVVSPGVPPAAAPLAVAREAGVPVVAELDLAARALAGVPLVVVTGTNGKTTTTSLIAHLLQSSGVAAEAAGNIGRPLIGLAERASSLQLVVVEASSFQLHDAPNLMPAIGVVTNLAPDHLDRYDSVESYYADKQLLFRNATDASVWILNGDDEGVQQLAAGVPGERRIWSTRGVADAWWNRASGSLMLGDQAVVERGDVPLLGDHNVENVLAAILVAAAAGVECSQIAAALPSFQGLPHRLEPVREVDGALWINDSKGTNVASTRVALAAMDRPFVLIAGGQDKGEPLDSLVPFLAECRRVVAYGEAAAKIRQELGRSVETDVVATLESAVRSARGVVQAGDAVLLSPACASFDQFHDYEERGNVFKQLVGAL